MSPDRQTPRASRRDSPPRVGPPPDQDPADADQIAEAYLRRAITELADLNEHITASAPCRADELPVLASGSPQAQIMLIKWAPNLAERQEGVAFFGRAGSAILKSVQRLGIDPLQLYGTLCVKCADTATDADEPAPEIFLEWLSHEIQIVQPALIVPMGERVIGAINRMGHPSSAPLETAPGRVQQWTPSIDALYVPDIDASLDEQGAKRAFWSAFRAVGTWHNDQPPY